MHNYDWTDDALCSDLDVDDFFTDSTRHEVEAALPGMAVCPRCPVRAECLEFALERKMWFGVWGGRTTEERKAIAAARAMEPSH